MCMIFRKRRSVQEVRLQHFWMVWRHWWHTLHYSSQGEDFYRVWNMNGQMMSMSGIKHCDSAKVSQMAMMWIKSETALLKAFVANTLFTIILFYITFYYTVASLCWSFAKVTISSKLVLDLSHLTHKWHSLPLGRMRLRWQSVLSAISGVHVQRCPCINHWTPSCFGASLCERVLTGEL